MRKTFEQLVLGFLDDIVIESKSYGDNEITLRLTDVNFKVLGISWEDKLSQYLSFHKHKVRFTYGNEEWVTVHKIN